MKNQKSVFISHANSSNDRAFADNLAFHLSINGYEIWQDAQIDAGQNWERELRKALHDAAAVIVLFSSDWAESKWTAFEFGAAKAIGKKIIPVLISNANWNNPPLLKSMHLIDATKGNNDQLISSIVAAIKN